MDDALQHRKGETGAARPPEPARLDLRGLRCPLPALRARRRLAGSAPGALLLVLADDPLAPLDIRHLCGTEGHEILRESRPAPGEASFLIRRRP